MNGIELLISDIENTKELFMKGSLHSHSSKDNKCYYCAGGIILKEAGVNKNDFLDKSSIAKVDEDYDIAYDMLNNRYGLDFGKDYDEPIKCPICKKNEEQYIDSIGNLATAIYHINDFHSTSFKQVAENLKEIGKEFNLVTGKRI